MISFPNVEDAIAYCEGNDVRPCDPPEFDGVEAYVNVRDENGKNEQIFFFHDYHIAVELFSHYNPWY